MADRQPARPHPHPEDPLGRAAGTLSRLLAAIDAEAGIETGGSFLRARVFDPLDVVEGATVMQLGAGLRYLIAFLAGLAGPSGRVVA